MTQVTEHGTPLQPAPAAPAPPPPSPPTGHPTAGHPTAGSPRPAGPRRRRRSPAAAACVLGGAVAAGLGLGFLAVLVIVLWISSPYPDSGPGGALHLAAGLWLLAHGAELVRYDTLSGVPAPVGMTPLLLIALPALLMRRAARLGSVPGDGSDAEEVLPASAVFSAVLCGYLGVGTFATVYAAAGPMPADPISAGWHVPLVAVLAAAGGVWAAKGRPLGPPPLPRRWPAGVRRALARPRYALALRSGAAGALVLLGGGALILGASLVWHAAEVKGSFLALTDVWSGRFAVLLLALALLPNAVVWAAAYALGPGFALGSGAAATPLGFTGSPALPRFPLLEALPPQGSGTLVTCATALVPLAAGAAVGWFAVRRAREVSGAETALTAALGAVVCAVVLAGLAAASAGPLGSGELAEFGPVWWATGAAALAWTLPGGVVVAVSVHVWRTHPARGAEPADDDGWHDRGMREMRWEALRKTAGTLIPPFPQPGTTPPALSAAPTPRPPDAQAAPAPPPAGAGAGAEADQAPPPAGAEAAPADPSGAAPAAPAAQGSAVPAGAAERALGTAAVRPRRLALMTTLDPSALARLPLPQTHAPAPPEGRTSYGTESPQPRVVPVAGARVLARRRPPA
ncbi:DUF6350 family protein [Streptomyces sp. NPDC046866]|uniref:cell division protein PerM n=1 Tax=Streptomyces sp. NPDC046866 TaxID=3154921 RepID=UPI0034528B4D